MTPLFYQHKQQLTSPLWSVKHQGVEVRHGVQEAVVVRGEAVCDGTPVLDEGLPPEPKVVVGHVEVGVVEEYRLVTSRGCPLFSMVRFARRGMPRSKCRFQFHDAEIDQSGQ